MTENKEAIHPRKLEIVEAAVRCFLERGYHQTGVRDIARQAGVSLGNLYNHFKGKEAVLVFIAEIEVEELSGFIADLQEASDPKKAIEAFITGYTAYVSDPDNALLGAEILTEALRNPVIEDAFGKNRNALIDALTACLEAGVKVESFGPFEDLTPIAHLILDSIEAHGLRVATSTEIDPIQAQSLHQALMNALQS